MLAKAGVGEVARETVRDWIGALATDGKTANGPTSCGRIGKNTKNSKLELETDAKQIDIFWHDYAF